MSNKYEQIVDALAELLVEQYNRGVRDQESLPKFDWVDPGPVLNPVSRARARQLLNVWGIIPEILIPKAAAVAMCRASGSVNLEEVINDLAVASAFYLRHSTYAPPQRDPDIAEGAPTAEGNLRDLLVKLGFESFLK